MARHSTGSAHRVGEQLIDEYSMSGWWVKQSSGQASTSSSLIRGSKINRLTLNRKGYRACRCSCARGSRVGKIHPFFEQEFAGRCEYEGGLNRSLVGEWEAMVLHPDCSLSKGIKASDNELELCHW